MRQTWKDRLREDMHAQEKSGDEEAHVQFVLRDLEHFGLRDLAEDVARVYGVTLYEMLGPSHEPAPAKARRVLWAILYGKERIEAVQIARAYNPALRAKLRRIWSYPALGRLFGRDHTTVMVGVDKVSDLDIDETLRSFDGWEAV